MADELDPNAASSEPPAGSSRPASRRKQMTRELRKFLGPGRSWHDRESAKDEATAIPEPAPSLLGDADATPPTIPSPSPWASADDEPEPEPAPDRRRTPPPMALPN